MAPKFSKLSSAVKSVHATTPSKKKGSKTAQVDSPTPPSGLSLLQVAKWEKKQQVATAKAGRPAKSTPAEIKSAVRHCLSDNYPTLSPSEVRVVKDRSINTTLSLTLYASY